MVKNTLTSLINASFPVRFLMTTTFTAAVVVLETGILNISVNLPFFFVSLPQGIGLGVTVLLLGLLLALVLGSMQKKVSCKS